MENKKKDLLLIHDFYGDNPINLLYNNFSENTHKVRITDKES